MQSTSAAMKTNQRDLPHANTNEDLMPEDSLTLASATEKIIQNIVTQGQINDAIVRRLLSIEQKIMEPAASSELPQAVPASMSAPSIASGSVQANDPLPMYLGNSLAMCRVLNTFPMYVDARDTLITPSLLLHGMWEPVVTRLFMQSLQPGMVVVDVGANYSYYTLLAAAAVGSSGRVIAFEPEPKNLDILIRNVELNSVADRVKVYPCVVADAKGKAELYVSLRNSAVHTVSPTETERASLPHIGVDTVALDDVITGPVDFIKIDAEGSEPLVFHGMKKILSRCPAIKILMEFNPGTLQAAGVNPDEFYKSLRKMGFQCRVLAKKGVLEEVELERLLCQELTALFLSHG